MSSNVNLTLDDYNSLLEARRNAENEAADLRKQLREAKLATGGDDRVRVLTQSVRNALEVVRFAVANMPPETVRGWPWTKLVAVSHDIEVLPDADSDDVSFAIELRKFAVECEKIERQRKAS